MIFLPINSPPAIEKLTNKPKAGASNNKQKHSQLIQAIGANKCAKKS